MLSRLRLAIGLALVLALAAAWGLLFGRLEGVDGRRHAHTLERLQELRQLDAARDLAVLQARLDLRRDYDGLVGPLPRIAELMGELEQLAGEAGGSLPESVAQLRAALEQKADTIDLFQREDSLLKNSLRYVPTAHTQVGAALPGHADGRAAALHAHLGALMAGTLDFLAGPDAAGARALAAAARKASAALQDLPAPPREAVDNLLLHVDVLAQRGPAQESLLAALARTDVPARLDEAGARFTQQFEAQLRAQTGFQQALLAFAALAVLAVAGLVVWVLRRDAGELGRMRQTVEATRAELRASQAQLVHAEKMTLLGEVVAGIAHEINTPLAYLRSGLESVRENVRAVLQPALREQGPRYALEVLDETEGLVTDGLAGAQQINETIANLLNFSRLERSRVVRCRVETSLETTLRLARHLLKGKALVRHYGRTADVECDLPQLNQVFLNLVKNAAQACPAVGGEIIVTTGMADARTVRVEVRDNGEGIPAADLRRIFEPFYTTREAGSGLGLSISRTIVQAHGGSIDVASQPGVGTTFAVLLPRAQGDEHA